MKTKMPSPSRSQGAHTPRRKSRRTLSVGSPALSTASVRLSSVVQGFINNHMSSFALSPVMTKRKSVLTDNTDVMEEPRRKSWWNKLNENSRNALEVLEDNYVLEPNNIMEELDIEILSQEKKNYTLDIPESSDGESISSIVIPQKRLFPQKESQHQKKIFRQIIGNRETITKSNKNLTINDKVVNAGTKQLFQNKPRSKPLFPAALLDISPDKTLTDKTEEPAAVPKTQARNLFGNRQGAKRKNMFADFIVSENETEIPEIQARVFGFMKKPVLIRRGSSASRGIQDSSPTSNVTTDADLDEWRLLPSSTMVEHELEAIIEPNTPKRPRLSKLTETKESSGANTLFPQTKSPEVNTPVLTRSRLRELNNSATSTAGEKNKTQENLEQNKSKKNNKSRDNIKEDIKNSDQNEEENLRIADISPGKINKSRGKQNKSLQKTNVSLIVTDEVQNDHTKLNTSKNNNKNQSNVNETKNKSQNQLKLVDESQKIVGSEQNKDQGQEVVYGNEMVKVVLEAHQNQEQIDEQGHRNEVNVNPENSKQKVIAESQDVKESEDVNEIQKIDEYKEKVVEAEQEQYGGHEIESQEVVEKSNNEEVQESQDKINESQEQDDDNEEQTNESLHFEESMEQEDKGQAVDQSQAEVVESDEAIAEVDESNEAIAEVDESNEALDQSKVDENHEENVEEIEQTADKFNESNEEADENIEIADQNQEEDEIDENNQMADESNKTVNESNEAVNQTQEAVDGSNEAAEESNETVNQTQEEIDESEQSADESNEAVNQSQEEVNESNEEQNESQLAIDDDENETIEHDENTQEEVDESNVEQNESQEDDENEDVEDENESEEAELHYESASEEMEVDNEHQEDTPIDQENNTNTPEPAHNECNISHDTTDRNRNKHTSPEAVLHDKTKQSDSFAFRRNTSIRKTKSIAFTARDSIGLSDGTTNSSAEGSGWDSHRTTRKTIRQTFGKDATMRKSLRALVMEKSAKRQTLASETAKIPLANSTALPEISVGYLDQESTHEVSLRTRQMTLDAVLEKIKEDNLKKKAEIEEAVKRSLETRSDAHIFKVPLRPMFPRRQANQQNKASKVKAIWRDLPEEMIEDLQYKPPKRFKPSNAPWITKRLYKYLENKLEPKYDYKARVRAEKLVETMYNFTKDLRRQPVASGDATNVLKHEMARLQIVRTHHEFYEFFRQFMPKEIRIKVIPDVVNKIPLPRRDVFSDILTDSVQS